MRAGSGRRTALTLLLLAAMTLPFFYRLGAWPLFDPDEGRNAEVAREMAASGQWAVPRFDGQPYLDKPVLLFWAVAAVFRLRGVGEASARLPSALAAVAPPRRSRSQAPASCSAPRRASSRPASSPPRRSCSPLRGS